MVCSNFSWSHVFIVPRTNPLLFLLILNKLHPRPPYIRVTLQFNLVVVKQVTAFTLPPLKAQHSEHNTANNTAVASFPLICSQVCFPVCGLVQKHYTQLFIFRSCFLLVRGAEAPKHIPGPEAGLHPGAVQYSACVSALA